MLSADKNQQFARTRMTEEARQASPAVNFMPWIIADADTGHGGDAHVRNLVRRFVEVGEPGYHIEDQKRGAKKCGHQGGKVLVPFDTPVTTPVDRRGLGAGPPDSPKGRALHKPSWGTPS